MNVIAIDGGGIRGILSAVLLDRLEASVPGFLASTDLFAGTSTGGILALGLADGMPPAELRDLYRANGSTIFATSLLREVADLHGLIGAKYSNDGLRQVLVGRFGDRKLSSLGRRVLVPAFDLHPAGDGGWSPKFFHNYPGEDSDGDDRIVDVALRTSAGPTYFPTVGTFCDGGVVANNPSMAALAQVLDPRNGPETGRLEDVRLFSVGTGFSAKYIGGADLDWGDKQWVEPLINLLLDANLEVADYQCRQLLGARYARLAPRFPKGVTLDLDAVDKIDWLVEFAETVDISNVVQWASTAWVRTPGDPTTGGQT